MRLLSLHFLPCTPRAAPAAHPLGMWPALLGCALWLLSLGPQPLTAQVRAPYAEGFDSTPQGSRQCQTSPSAPLPPGWSHDPDAALYWQVSAGPTPTAGTGPSGGPSGGGRFLYFEASQGCGNQWRSAIVRLPACDLTALVRPVVRLSAHLHGPAIGQLRLEGRDPSGGAWGLIGSITGDQGTRWRRFEFDLAPVLSRFQVELRLLYTPNANPAMGSPALGDLAIDDLEIAEYSGLPSPGPYWQVNHSAASLTLDGVQVAGAYASQPATVVRCPERDVRMVASTRLAGQPFEWILEASPGRVAPVGGGGWTLVDGQMVNLDLFAPGLQTLLGWTFAVPSPASWSARFPARQLGGRAAFQCLWIDPVAASGLALSQATQFESDRTSVPSFPQAGPRFDDGELRFDFGCNSIRACDAEHRSFSVMSNGRILFGSGAADFTATVAEALSGAPFFGYWTDLNPALAPSSGGITVDQVGPGRYQASYQDIPYYGEPATRNSFTLEVDTRSGDLLLDGLSGIADNPASRLTGSDAWCLGVSAGGTLGATDAGPTRFLAPGAYLQPLRSDALYDFGVASPIQGRPDSLQGPTNSIRFTPLPGGGYAASAL